MEKYLRACHAHRVTSALELWVKFRVGLGRRFEAWRVKNTHREEATTVGGYRDVKVLGLFAASDALRMIVEIQVIAAA